MRCQILRRSSGGRRVKRWNDCEAGIEFDVEVERGDFCDVEKELGEYGYGSGSDVGIEFAGCEGQ